MRLVLKLQLPADARFLGRTRRAVAGYLEESGARPETADDVILALDEACANVIRHAYDGDGDGDREFRLVTEIDREHVTVEVEDDGRGFDLADVRARADLTSTSGRGLSIIRSLMTSVDVEPTETGGTRLRMQKLLRGA